MNSYICNDNGDNERNNTLRRMHILSDMSKEKDPNKFKYLWKKYESNGGMTFNYYYSTPQIQIDNDDLLEYQMLSYIYENFKRQMNVTMSDWYNNYVYGGTMYHETDESGDSHYYTDNDDDMKDIDGSVSEIASPELSEMFKNMATLSWKI